MESLIPPSHPDGLAPPPPQPPYVDPGTGALVLSRYADVLAAFADQRLWPVSAKGDDLASERDAHGSLLERGAVRDALSTARLAEWQQQIAVFARERLAQLPTHGAIELLGDFAKPVCLSLALSVTDANPADRARLAELGEQIFAGTGEPDDSPLTANRATAELTRYFEHAAVPMAQQTFLGISQTLPRLLANGWLALFQHAGEVARLRAEPKLIAHAVEELLRYAGIIPRLFRKAQDEVAVAGVPLATGARVTLMVASANRDPEKFADPDRLDVSRRATGQLQLGIGRSSCAGARLIRMANGVAIREMLDATTDITVTSAVRWHTGSGFCWPTSVEVAFKRR